MSKKTAIITISAGVGLLVITLITALVIFISTTTAYATQLENVYMRSLYELSENVSALEVDLSKLIATNSPDAQKDVLTSIYNTAGVANTNISNLPVNNESVNDINLFVNKLGGFSFSLIDKINNKIDFSEEEKESIVKLHSHSLVLLYEFTNYINSINFNYRVLSQLDYNNENSSSLNGVFDNIQSTNSKVPTLIYDGPFAESLVNPQVLGLTGDNITQEQAKDIIKSKFTMYGEILVEYESESNGTFSTFNFNVMTENLKLFVQITKKGGHVLDITSIGSGGNKNLSKSASENVARQFSRDLGFTDVHPVWSMANGNVAYVNLAPIVNGVIYYPDLIKVKVDSSLGVVTGWEARNYYHNHIERQLSAPQLTILQAEALLSENLEVIERNKALVPNKYVGETNTYEFICRWKDYTYYVYLDVETGAEVNILRLIKTDHGDLIL